MESKDLISLAEFICGDDPTSAPIYRSSSYLTDLFVRAGLSRFVHHGETRKWWVLDCLRQCTQEELDRIILALASPSLYDFDKQKIKQATTFLNSLLGSAGKKVQITAILTEVGPQSVIPPTRTGLNHPIVISTTPDFAELEMEEALANALKTRWIDVEKCRQVEAYLPAIVLMGSILEGHFTVADEQAGWR